MHITQPTYVAAKSGHIGQSLEPTSVVHHFTRLRGRGVNKFLSGGYNEMCMCQRCCHAQ
jgi:hypothetical protein